MKVALYYRVSTASQAEEDRYGLPAQRIAVERFCKRHKCEVVARYEDPGHSGASADRPGLALLLHDAGQPNEDGRKPPFDAVIVAKFDRLARDSMLDGYLRFTLKQRGVKVLSATEEQADDDNPTAKLLQGVLIAVAEFERSLIKARLMGGRRAKKAAGGYAEGRPRYGTRAENGSLIPDREEAAVVELVRSLRKKGLTIRAIAGRLNARGFSARHGRAWQPSTVHNVLKRLDRRRGRKRAA